MLIPLARYRDINRLHRTLRYASHIAPPASSHDQMSRCTHQQIRVLTSAGTADTDAMIPQMADWYIQGIFPDACLCTIRFDDKLPRVKMPVLSSVDNTACRVRSALMRSREGDSTFHRVPAPSYEEELDPTFVKFLRGSVSHAADVVAQFLPAEFDLDPTGVREERMEVPEGHRIWTLYDELVEHLSVHFRQHFLLGLGHQNIDARVNLQATPSGYELSNESKVEFLGRWQMRVGVDESECSSAGEAGASIAGASSTEPDRSTFASDQSGNKSSKGRNTGKSRTIAVDVFRYGDKLDIHRISRSDERGESYTWYAMGGQGVELKLGTVAKSERPIRPPLTP